MARASRQGRQAHKVTFGWETTSSYRFGGPTGTSLAAAPATAMSTASWNSIKVTVSLS